MKLEEILKLEIAFEKANNMVEECFSNLGGEKFGNPITWKGTYMWELSKKICLNNIKYFMLSEYSYLSIDATEFWSEVQKQIIKL